MSCTSATTESASARQPPNPSTSSTREAARANLYHLLATSLSLPGEMEQRHPAELLKLVPDLDPALQGAGRELAQAWEDALEDPKALSLAYARLFLGPFEILASPYASFYLEPDQRLMGEVSQEVARTYASAGLGPGNRPREVPDHVAMEWEFMYFLTYQYITTGKKNWLQQRRQFRTTHMNRWIPALVEAIIKAEQHAFYCAVARMLTAVLGDPELD